MCLPLSCLKTFLGIGTGITILLSLVSLGFGIYLLYFSNQLDTKAIYIDKVKLYKDIVQYSLIAFGAVLFVVGIFGSVGARKKSGCCLFLFQVGAIVFTTLFLAAGITTMQLSQQLVVDDCEQITWSKNISQLASASSQIFCKARCPCYLNPNNFTNQTVLIGYVYNPQNSSLPTQFQQCSDYSDDLDIPSAFLQTAETYFKCSGWCTPSSIFMFTDVNNGNPQSQNSCFTQMKTFVEDNGRYLSYVFYGVGSLLGLLVILAFCLCFHPGRAKKDVNFYERMGYND